VQQVCWLPVAVSILQASYMLLADAALHDLELHNSKWQHAACML
jgi:hypothetical protein